MIDKTIEIKLRIYWISMSSSSSFLLKPDDNVKKDGVHFSFCYSQNVPLK